MRILLTGGGSGGHFYPIIAVSQALNRYSIEKKLADVHLYYMAPQPYDLHSLYENQITFLQVPAGKRRIYFSLLNYLDICKTGWGILKALFIIFRIYPDVIFSKGGYVSFPALVAARILNIPVVVHESDSSPGRVNQWAGKFAARVAVSYPETTQFFDEKKVAYTGNPIREELKHPITEGAFEFLGLDQTVPTILIIGGSQGAQIINENVAEILFELVKKYQIIHQTGKGNFAVAKETANVLLKENPFKDRYKPLDYIDSLTLRNAAGIADIIISRSGSTIFEIAVWGIAAILIPITESNGDHQRKNAYSYARVGAAIVIEEGNLSPHVLLSEIDNLMNNPAERDAMKKAASTFAHSDAAELIAKEIVGIALEHEK